MFQSMNRILRWTKGYHRRLYLGSLCSFLATWAAAGPAMLTAWALGLVIESAQEGTALDARLPWLCLGGIILLIVLRFVCAYWKNRLQESIGTERAAQQRLELGDLLKRVSAGTGHRFVHGVLLPRGGAGGSGGCAAVRLCPPRHRAAECPHRSGGTPGPRGIVRGSH